MCWFFESAFKFIFSLEKKRSKMWYEYTSISVKIVKTFQLLFSMFVDIFPIYLKFGFICFKILALAWCPVSFSLASITSQHVCWDLLSIFLIILPSTFFFFFQLNLSTQVRIMSKFSLSSQISHIKWTILKSVSFQLNFPIFTEIVTIFSLYICAFPPFPLMTSGCFSHS